MDARRKVLTRYPAAHVLTGDYHGRPVYAIQFAPHHHTLFTPNAIPTYTVSLAWEHAATQV